MIEPVGYVAIREAAIALFAERGPAGASILDIATAAGVSGGLIRHHFGSKELLRQHCDDHVFAEVRAFKADSLARLESDPTYVPHYDERILRYYRYLGRATMDGTPAAARHFAHMVGETEDWLRGESGHDLADPAAVAAVFAAYSIGFTALYDIIAATLGADANASATMQRLAAAAALIHATPWLSPDFAHRLQDPQPVEAIPSEEP